MIGYYLLGWLLLAIIAIANGILREKTYGTRMSELSAHQLSTLTGTAATAIAIWLMSRAWPLGSGGEAVLVGICWLGMTVAFEFVFGRFVAGHSWQRLFADYNVFKGRVWPLFLVWITVAPWLFYRLAN